MTATLTIRDIRARPVMVPFKRPPVSASGALPHAALELVDLETEEGITGRSSPSWDVFSTCVIG